jgi:hypothetical protein
VFAGRLEREPRPLGERLHPELRERRVDAAQLLARARRAR